MKRFFVCSVSFFFFLAAAVLADVTMRDIWHWGLVRKSDVLPLATTQQVEAAAAALAVHTNRTDNPHGVTAAQIGALTAEADPVAGPRLDRIEAETNKWNAAYGWGNHAVVGYLTNETDSIAFAVMATNRTTVVFNPTNSNEFTDGAMRVWRIDTVTNTFIGWSVVIETPISVCGEVIQPSTNQWPGIPYPLWTDSALSFTQFITNYPAGSTQPMVVWYYYRTGSASPHEVHFSSPAEESSANWHSTYGSSSAGASPRELLGQDDASTFSWISMIYGTNISVSVVTSLVSTVAWQSDLAVFATTQQVAAAVAPLATTGHVAQAIAAIPEPDLSDRPTFAQIAASNALPYTAWTGTVTPQNGTATVAYAHGNMPVLVVPNGGGTTRVTVATGTYAATSGVSRVSLSIWAGTNTIEFVTNEVDYATAPDIPTNGWGTILFRRVSDGRWKGVGL